MTSPTTAAPGWYADGVTPGVVRWFDGSAWTAHTAPLPVTQPGGGGSGYPAHESGHPAHGGGYPAHEGGYPVHGGGYPAHEGGYPVHGGGYPAHVSGHTYPPAGAYGTSATSADHGPSGAMHWILPVGRSWQSVVAGYVGLFALVVWPLGPIALWLGIAGLRRARDGGHGSGRAVFGIVTGALATAAMVAFLFSQLT